VGLTALFRTGTGPDRGMPPATHAFETLTAVPCCRTGEDTPVEGRYFTVGSPPRRNLATPEVAGVLLSLTGRVLDEERRRVPDALVEFWHTVCRDDTATHTDVLLRGHQFTGDDGGYSLGTVVPTGSPGRAPHLHVKVQAPGGPVLHSQLFFPHRTRVYGTSVRRLNARDPFRSRRWTISLGPLAHNHYPGTFDFVIETR
jgi:protocatechuate 3,4-dioxygenase beta subunit